MHDDRFVDLEPGHAGAELLDPAGRLVAEGERPWRRHRPVHHVQVGVAQARATHPHQHLAGSGLGPWDLAELGGLLAGDDLVGSHEAGA